MFHSMVREQGSLDTEFINLFINMSRDKHSFDSPAGRAEDCRGTIVILRSLVRIRLEEIFLSVFFTTAFYNKMKYIIFLWCN